MEMFHSCVVQAHLPRGKTAAFWRSVPLIDTDQVGSATSGFAQLLMASQQGPELWEARSSPDGDVPQYLVHGLISIK